MANKVNEHLHVQIEETTDDANEDRELNNDDEICRHDIFNTIQLDEVK